MKFGNNILSPVPADWATNNATITGNKITMQSGGTVMYSLTYADVVGLQEAFLINVIADAYFDDFTAKVEILATEPDNTYTNYVLPLIDTGGGFLRAIITFPTNDYKFLYFKITTTVPLVITEWSMHAPVVGEDFTEIIDGVKKEIPKLLWDYNTLEFQIGQEESTIGMISAKLLKNVDLEGHLHINFTASEDSMVSIRIYDNEIQELYSPIERVVKRGRNSVGIPHSYIQRKVGIHNFIITMQVWAGTLTVETRGVLYSIDGGYLATRIMDVGYEVFDITLKQLPENPEPSEIYAVCIDEGNALIRKRVYNEEVAVAWEPAYIIEDAVMACIDFNGLWILRPEAIGFTLETDKDPYVMWIDQYKNLWSQKGPDESTKFLLAELVDYVSACMTYNYAPDIQYDQGLVCAYIKSGIVYYKNLCRQDLVGTMVWGPERELTLLGSGNTQVTVARLNDYRCVINTINSKSQWLISNRGYVGQAVRPEQLFGALKFEGISASQTALQLVYTETKESLQGDVPQIYAIGNQLGSETALVDQLPSITEHTWLDSTHVVLHLAEEWASFDDSLDGCFLFSIQGVPVDATVTLTPSNLNIELSVAISAPKTLIMDVNAHGMLVFQSGNYRYFVPSFTHLIPYTNLHTIEGLLGQASLMVNSCTQVALQTEALSMHNESVTGTTAILGVTSITVIQYGESPV